jgi:hypothetical protein
VKCSVESGSACPLGPARRRADGGRTAFRRLAKPGSLATRHGACSPQRTGSESMNLTTVRVDISMRGVWVVALPDRGEGVMCETLEVASRVAYRSAADRRPSELIVCDAYRRVVHRELIDVREGHGRAPRKASELVRSSRSEAWLRGPIRQRQSRR